MPCAAAGSLPFLPQPAIRVLKTIKNRYGAGAWCRYGFVDAFNPLKNWFDTDVIGIDTGITMVMAENARTGFVWDTFMRNPEAQRAMERAGFTRIGRRQHRKRVCHFPRKAGRPDHPLTWQSAISGTQAQHIARRYLVPYWISITPILAGETQWPPSIS